MDVSIIIVNYNTKQLLADCLNSIFAQTIDLDFEVIVSDNSSTDGSLEMLKADFPQVILIENNANLGFGAANNRGLAVAKGKYVFYLNSDTILINNAVKLFFDYFEENGEKENIGALGCNLLNKNGEIIHSYGDFLKLNEINHILNNLIHTVYGNFKLYLLLKVFHKAIPVIENKKHYEKKTGQVEYITGADLFMRNNDSALYDEQYFMYCEEMDLQYILSKQKKYSFIIDSPKIIHLEGGSEKKATDIIRQEANFSRINWRMSQIYFFKKNGIRHSKIFLFKLATFLLWLNPLIFKQTQKYMKKLWQI